jgi:hypothetical protein
MGARIVGVPGTQLLTIYTRHQIIITELEIGAIGTDFSRRRHGGQEKKPGRARTWKSMKNLHVSEMHANAKHNPKLM